MAVFVDTGAWFAYFVRRDPDHRAATAWMRRNRQPLVTTDYILDELLTLLRMRESHRVAVAAGEALWQQRVARIEHVTLEDIARTWEVFRQYHDKEGVGPEVKIVCGSESADDLLLYKTRRETFTAGIQGCAWLSNEPYQSLRPIGPCEQLMLSTRDWYLDASSKRDAYKIGRGLSYVFFQLDKWNQPLEIALELRKRLRAHSVRFVRETHQKGESTPYGLNEVLSEFGRITAEALSQIYYDPSNHMREVWLYVQRGFAQTP